MLRFVQRSLFQNYRIQHRKLASLAYQFKVNKAVYYPDRQAEMQRINEQMKSQLVAEKQEGRKLPKDYYYKVLGLRKQATTQQIKTAYYALAKRLHPDANNSQASKRFQEVSNAYHILTDDTKRLEYDQLGVVKDEQTFLKTVTDLSKMIDTNTSDLPFTATREELIQITNCEPRLELTFLEAAHGLKKKVDLRFLKKCPACGGRAPKLVSRKQSETCRKCLGKGQILQKTSSFKNNVTCDLCLGKGILNRNQCDTCDSRGIMLETVKVEVPVAPGVKSGDVVTIDNPITNQRVSYRITVKENDYYRRMGTDVHTDKYLTISEAVLGGTFKIRGIYGPMELKVQPGTESHTQVILEGKGIKTSAEVGSHIVTLKVRIPRQLTMKQRQLILALAKTEEPTFERVF